MRDLLLKRDLSAGVILIAIGIGAVFEGRTNTVGTLSQMGAGYFPIGLGIVLACLGLVIVLQAIFAPPSSDGAEVGFSMPDWRGAIAIVAGLVAFIIFGQFFGLAAATFSCVFLSAMGARDGSFRGAVILAVAMTVVAVVLFAYLLRIPFPIWQLPD